MDNQTVNNIVPIYVWFTFGFSLMGIAVSMLNFGMLVVTMVTVKGIVVPVWIIIPVGAGLVTVCILVGYFSEKYKIWGKIVSRQNRNANPEVNQIANDVKEIKAMLENKK
jgi:hypothetical protein